MICISIHLFFNLYLLVECKIRGGFLNRFQLK